MWGEGGRAGHAALDILVRIYTWYILLHSYKYFVHASKRQHAVTVCGTLQKTLLVFGTRRKTVPVFGTRRKAVPVFGTRHKTLPVFGTRPKAD